MNLEQGKNFFLLLETTSKTSYMAGKCSATYTINAP